jgi:hypothetical protein
VGSDPAAEQQPAQAYIDQVQQARQQDPWVQVSARMSSHCSVGACRFCSRHAHHNCCC